MGKAGKVKIATELNRIVLKSIYEYNNQKKRAAVSCDMNSRFSIVKDNHSLSEWIKSLQLWTKINSCNTIEATDNRNKSKTGGLMKDIDSLAHTKWRCQYHIVFAPKYRRQIIYGKYKAAIGKILRRICERCEGVEIIEANA